MSCYPLIPRPAEQSRRPGVFPLSSPLQILDEAPPAFAPTVAWLADEVHAATRDAIARPDGAGKPAARIAIQIDPELDAEAYALQIEPASLTLRAADAAGAFYGAQTVIQLVRIAAMDDGEIPCGEIHDRPRYAWRGMMLDSARHFQPVAWIKRLIDQLAALKLNRLHWHLCDDQGWRPEILRYPRLTDVAAWRPHDGEPYGGFYTQDEMREVVAYAEARHIQIIPEIEMPGHCNAALYAYPHLSCSGTPLPIGDGWAAYTEEAGRLAFCAGRAETFTFLEHVVEEIVDVFGPRHIHLGGDERPAGTWEGCPRCQETMRRHGLTSESALHGWFMRRVSDYCRDTLGCTPIAWVDDLAVGVPEGQIAHGWHEGDSAGAARLGARTINSNHEWTYFDYPCCDADRAIKPDWMLTLPLEKVYHFDPTPDGLEPRLHDRILGSEAAMWTEYAPDEAALRRQLMPRLVAFSEVMWSPRWGRSFDEFAMRLETRQRAGLDGLAQAPAPGTRAAAARPRRAGGPAVTPTA